MTHDPWFQNYQTFNFWRVNLPICQKCSSHLTQDCAITYLIVVQKLKVGKASALSTSFWISIQRTTTSTNNTSSRLIAGNSTLILIFIIHIKVESNWTIPGLQNKDLWNLTSTFRNHELYLIQTLMCRWTTSSLNKNWERNEKKRQNWATILLFTWSERTWEKIEIKGLNCNTTVLFLWSFCLLAPKWKSQVQKLYFVFFS